MTSTSATLVYARMQQQQLHQVLRAAPASKAAHRTSLPRASASSSSQRRLHPPAHATASAPRRRSSVRTATASTTRAGNSAAASAPASRRPAPRPPVDPRVRRARRAATPRRSWAARTSTVHLAGFAHVIFLVGVPGASANRAAASAHARSRNYQVFKLVSSKATAARVRAYAFNSSAMGNQHARASAHTAPTGYEAAKLLAAKCMRALANRMHQQLAAAASSGRVRAGAHLPASPPTALSSGCSYHRGAVRLADSVASGFNLHSSIRATSSTHAHMWPKAAAPRGHTRLHAVQQLTTSTRQHPSSRMQQQRLRSAPCEV